MRTDGRNNNELRPIKFTRNYTKHSLGSVLVEFGETKVLVCANYEDAIPKWMDKESPEGWLSAEYSLLFPVLLLLLQLHIPADCGLGGL